MWSLLKKSLLLTIVLGWSLAAHGAAAEQCLDRSPTIQKGGDPYGPLDTRKLTPEEHQMLVHLFKSLDGDWQGTADTFFCRSSSDPADVELGHETIKATVDVDRNGNLHMTAEFYSERWRTSSQKQMWLYLNNQLLRYNNDNGSGDVELIKVSADQVSFLFRSIMQRGTGGSTRQEFFITLTAVQDGFRIEEKLYVQTKLSSGYTWQFQR